MKLRREDGPEGAVELQAVISSSSSGNEAARSAVDARTAQRQPSVRHGLRALVSGSKLNVLLLAIPFAVVSRSAWSDGWTFTFSLLAICPLAERLGFITEQLAEYTSDTVGGLLNATFGNATEVIVSLMAMRAGMLRVTQLSLLGSVLSNMLLVLGTSFFVGGLRYSEGQRFSTAESSLNVNLLFLAVTAQTLPSMLSATHTELRGSASILTLSRISSMVMVLLYAGFLHHQLREHAPAAASDASAGKDENKEALDSAPGDQLEAATTAAAPASRDDEDDEADELVLTFRTCLGALAVVTLLISVLSEYVVHSIEHAADAWGVPLSFMSVIVLPIVGNAAEHSSAIIFALKNKMDVALGVAVGSSTQIAVGVTPACVLAGMLMSQPLTLDLQPFETGALLFGVLCLAHALETGTSNWMSGATLVAAYVVLAAAFAMHGDPQLQHEHIG